MDYQLIRIIYCVEDVEKTASYYNKVFGYQVARDPDYQPSQWLELITDRCNIGLYKGSEGANIFRTVYFVEDITVARRQLIEEGADMEVIESRGQFLICNGTDPSGIRIQLSNRDET